MLKMINLIEKAEKFAVELHTEQRKWSGEPYHNHLRRVVSLVSKFTDNEDLIAAAWLHDSHEDYPEKVPIRLIGVEFNYVVQTLVWELTNQYTKTECGNWNREKRKKEEFKRLSRCSWSARFIKLCDRYDNIVCYKNDVNWETPEHQYYIDETLWLLKELKGTHKCLEQEIKKVIQTHPSQSHLLSEV